jgi:MFS family permease
VTLGIILVLYNLYVVSLGYKTDFIGLLLFVGTIGAGVAIFPAGFCFDRFGGKVILIWSSVLIGIAGAGQMLFRTPVPLLVSSFFVGIGGAFVLVVNAPFLTANSTSDERPHLFSLAIVLTLVTTVLGEVLGGALPLWLRSISWFMVPLPAWYSWLLAAQPLARSYQLTLLLAGIIAAPSFIPLFLISEPRPSRGGRQPQTAPHRPLSPREMVGIELDEVEPLIGSPAQPNASFWSRLQPLLHWRRQPLRVFLLQPLFVLTMFQALLGAGAGLFLPYVNLLFVQHLRASPALFGIIDGGANTLNALLALLAPWAVVRFGKMATLIVPRLLSIPLMLVIGLTSSLPLAAACYPFRQGFMDMSQGILQLFSMEAVAAQQRGFANSSYQVAYQVAWALTASLGGLIIAHFGYAPVCIGAALLYSLALLLLWGRFGRVDNGKDNISLPDVQAEIVHL